MGGHTLVGMLSGIWTQSGIVAASKCATVCRQFREAAVPAGECGPCPVFASYFIPRHSPYKWGKSRKNLSQGSRKVPNWAALSTIRLVDLATVLRATSVRYLRFAQLRVSPDQLTLSRSSRLGLWCDRQRMELPSACYRCTKVHQQQREHTWTESRAASWHGNGRRTWCVCTEIPLLIFPHLGFAQRRRRANGS
jgi:hypothetical protein